MLECIQNNNIQNLLSRPLNFKLRYEFIDFLQDGVAIEVEHEHNCNRKFVSSQIDKKEVGTFRSTRNIFLFGRGGTSTLKYNQSLIFLNHIHINIHFNIDAHTVSKGNEMSEFELSLKELQQDTENVFQKLTWTQIDHIVLVIRKPD